MDVREESSRQRESKCKGSQVGWYPVRPKSVWQEWVKQEESGRKCDQTMSWPV